MKPAVPSVHAFAANLEDGLFPAFGHVEAAGEDGDVFPSLTGLEAGFVEA
jgi:hypothetical protein